MYRVWKGRHASANSVDFSNYRCEIDCFSALSDLLARLIRNSIGKPNLNKKNHIYFFTNLNIVFDTHKQNTNLNIFSRRTLATIENAGNVHDLVREAQTHTTNGLFFFFFAIVLFANWEKKKRSNDGSSKAFMCRLRKICMCLHCRLIDNRNLLIYWYLWNIINGILRFSHMFHFFFMFKAVSKPRLFLIFCCCNFRILSMGINSTALLWAMKVPREFTNMIG